jgi:hypothetical protein
MRQLALAVPGTALLVALVGGCGQPAATSEGTPLPHYTSVSQLAAAAGAQQRADRFVKLHLTGVTTDNPPRSMTGDGEITFDAGGPRMRIEQSIQPLNAAPSPAFTLLILPSQALLQPPPGTVATPPGKSWFQIRQAPGNPTLAQFSQVVQSLRDSGDPVQTFAQLGDAASTVTSGDEVLDGVPSVRYTVSLDLAKATQQRADPSVTHAVADLVRAGRAADDTTLWLDARNRPLRMVLSRTISSDGGAHTTYVVTVRYRDWGVPVDVPAPVPAQIVGN